MRKLTIAKRIQLSNLISIAMILVVGFLSFHYLNEMHSELNQLITRDIHLARLAEGIKSQTYDLQRAERKFYQNPGDRKNAQSITAELTELLGMIDKAKQGSSQPEIIAHYRDMAKYHGEYRRVVTRIARGNAEHGDFDRLASLRSQLRSANRDVLDSRYQELEAHQAEAQRVASNAERNMIIVLLLVLSFAVILGVVSPQWVSAPFKKLIKALGEVRTGKLNTVIPVRTDDEVGALTKTFNSTIATLREFDELKVQRIAFERRRFEALANMVDYGVIVMDGDGYIRFINSQLYLFLGLHSEDVVGNKIDQTALPETLRAFLRNCLESNEKFDNVDLTVCAKQEDGSEVCVDLLADDTICSTKHSGTLQYLITLEDKGAHAQKHYLKRKIAGGERDSAS